MPMPPPARARAPPPSSRERRSASRGAGATAAPACPEPALPPRELAAAGAPVLLLRPPSPPEGGREGGEGGPQEGGPEEVTERAQKRAGRVSPAWVEGRDGARGRGRGPAGAAPGPDARAHAQGRDRGFESVRVLPPSTLLGLHPVGSPPAPPGVPSLRPCPRASRARSAPPRPGAEI